METHMCMAAWMRARTVTQKIKIKKSFADDYKNKNCLRALRYRWPIRSALPTPLRVLWVMRAAHNNQHAAKQLNVSEHSLNVSEH